MGNPQNISSVPTHKESKIDDWFNEIIHELQTDKMLMKNHAVGKGKEELYTIFMQGDAEKMATMGRDGGSQYFIKQIIRHFAKELSERKIDLCKLALSHGNSHMLVWAEIKDEDEASEDQLLLAEATVNAYFHKFGFHVFTTIIESSDNVPVPAHYSLIPLSN